MPNFRIAKREISADEIEIAPTGHMSRESTEEFQQYLDEALRGPYGTIALSLESLESINSAAIGKILHFKKRCDELGRRLLIRRCNPEILQLLKMIKFDTLIPVEE